MNVKILIIVRGCPGSGKSTLAKQLGKGGVVLGSDDFFMVNGKYEFDMSAIGDAHSWNVGRVEKAMKQNISPIVVDNTNTQAWEAKPYVELARKYGYNVEIKEPTTPWKFDANELTKRNTHGVPREAIEKMLRKWEPNITIEDILQSEKPDLTPKPENWYTKSTSGGNIPSISGGADYPYSTLEIIKMQNEKGLPLKTMSFIELKDAKGLEENGFIIKKIMHDDKGRYFAYVINKDKFKEMGWKI